MFRGERLKELRIKKGLTQAELGELVGLTKSAICFYEKNKRTPSIENIIDFMQIFAVTADYLIGTDKLIKTISNSDIVEITTMTLEEVNFIEELKKNKTVYNILLEDPKRGAELVKKKVG